MAETAFNSGSESRAGAGSGRGSGPRPRRSLGQNFLQDANIARKIVRALQLSDADQVLEIGPGPGALTGHLLKEGPRRLLLIEKDPHWAKERQAGGMGRLQTLLCDAMTMTWERFAEPWKFIGNLPYNVASPLMWEIFSRAPNLERAVFMVQKEVGLRLTAKPGCGAYGALSVWVQSFVRPKLEFLVPPHVFKPRPKVDSAVLVFTPLAKRNAFCRAALAATLKGCFQMRRKQLGVIIKAGGGDPAALGDLGLDPRLRPENLSPEQFLLLAAAGFFSGKH